MTDFVIWDSGEKSWLYEKPTRREDGFGSVWFPNGSVAAIPGDLHGSVLREALGVWA